jgi:hypothetical protein
VNRAARRRNESLARSRRALVHKRIEQIIRTDGDNCSLCRAEFRHNSRTYGGITGDGVVAITGECCASKLDTTFISGIYTTRSYVEPSRMRNGPDKELSSEQIEEAIPVHQQYYAAVDEFNDTTARRAGVPAEKMMLHLEDTAWKDDDRAWFENNPTRSHRLRRLLPGEMRNSRGAAPPGHELQILVRQVEPGLRVRTGFFRNLEIDDIPDIEPMIHALFDLMAGRESRMITVRELAALAMSYAKAPRACL